MSRPQGFARIPHAEFQYPECQQCYFHNREPAICENCQRAANFEPIDNLDEHMGARKAALVRFHGGATSIDWSPIFDGIEPETDEELDRVLSAYTQPEALEPA